MQRVQKIIANAGYCSRRSAEKLIIDGEVKVNGIIAKIGDTCESDDKITISGKRLQSATKIYILLNKPIRYVCSLHPTGNLPSVITLLPQKERLYPVGRLDAMTEGLLLFTNDGDFANLVMHPRYEVKKTYRAILTHTLNHRGELALRKGVQLEDGKTQRATLKIHNTSRTDVSITIHEGKNRIIRRMFESIGYGVRQLTRTQIGPLTLGKLTPGEWRVLTRGEMVSLVPKHL